MITAVESVGAGRGELAPADRAIAKASHEQGSDAVESLVPIAAAVVAVAAVIPAHADAAAKVSFNRLGQLIGSKVAGDSLEKAKKLLQGGLAGAAGVVRRQRRQKLLEVQDVLACEP